MMKHMDNIEKMSRDNQIVIFVYNKTFLSKFSG